jgi:large subunit ribosomal protein L11
VTGCNPGTFFTNLISHNTFKSCNVDLYKPTPDARYTGRHGEHIMAEVVEVLVPGGKATAGPPLGPALGPLGINVKAVVDEINKKTGTFNGMQVPVKVEVDDKKQFTVTVGVPPTTALIKKEAGIEKGSAEPNVKVVGNLPFEAAVRIAKMKLDGMLSYELKTAVKEVLGTCVSLGVTIDGKAPKEVIALINEGKYDSALVN